MWPLGRSRAVAESRRAWAMLLLTAPALVWSCGGTSENRSGNAGVGGGSGSGASSVAGAAGSKQGGGSTAGGKAGQGAGGGTVQGGQPQAAGAGQATGGAASAQAGASVGGSDAGAAGATERWDPELLGFACDAKRCSVGQACIRCMVEGTSSRICVPSPATAPAGYAAATETCDKPLTTVFDECDGPEDCSAAQFCVAAEGPNGFMRCRDQPSTSTGSCCFACGAPTDCTLCRSAADCPGNVACQPAQAAPAGIMGCERG